jgi:peptide deformylase
MAYRKITRYPERVLRTKAKKVGKITPEIQRLIDDMIETMYQAKGVGLAAPQVGIPLRVIIVDTPEGAIPVVNPVISSMSRKKVKEEEGCLSVPGFFFEISRSQKACVTGLTREGKRIEMEAEDLVARIFQHEVDHVNGKLILNRIGVFKRLKIIHKVKKRAKEEWR